MVLNFPAKSFKNPFTSLGKGPNNREFSKHCIISFCSSSVKKHPKKGPSSPKSDFIMDWKLHVHNNKDTSII